MSYIGNPIVSTDFPKDTFSGNGSTTAFTMSIAPASVNSVIVVVSGITQDPSTYTISGTTLTFSAAPPTGTSNISVRHLGVAGTPYTPATASVGTAALSATGTPSASTFLRGDNTWAAAGAINNIFYLNGQTITDDYTIADNTNAGSFGPITIDTGVDVVIGTNSYWTI